MQITFEFYGVLQRLAGKASSTITLNRADACVGDGLDLLLELVPSLAPELERCACAIGDCMVSRQDALEPGTVVALLPPVAGG